MSVLFYVGFRFDLLGQGLTKALAGLELFHQFSKCYGYRHELSSLLPGMSLSQP